MKSELDDANEKIIEIAYESFKNTFQQFKDFNKFDEFVENCLERKKSC